VIKAVGVMVTADFCTSATSLVPRFSVGREKESLVSTVSRNFGKSETIVLNLYNRDDITYTYRYIVRTLSDQRWKRFDCSFSCALLRPQASSDS